MNRTIIYTISNPQYLRKLEKCSTFDQLKQIHTQTITVGLVRFTYITSKLLAFSAISDIDYAHTILIQISMPTIFDFNTMILGYSKTSKRETGVLLYAKMRNEGIKPNARTFPMLIRTCDCLRSLRQVHGQVVKYGNVSDVYVTSLLISMYSSYKAIELAKQVFEESAYKNVVCCTSLITGCFSNGLIDDAFLVACNHKTLLKKPWSILGKMSKVYDVQLTIEHYGCMIDLLARSGQLKEAEKLTKLMPMTPDGAIWGSFLHGCLTRNAIHLAETAGKRLLELEPTHSGRYVGLANMYASNGSWEGVIKLTKMMKERKVAIAPGWSFIEVYGNVNKFFVDDQCHPQAKDIHDVLTLLNIVLMN
ncbi:putative tetratricopeptide-like helical domain superfamily [Helianthus annuus]|nr:putative tetratricopeptide-like helical domain superfamily [Helianthus annuus]KAJ0712541.1 putative tetratricopeptide-like helical domain superfamily [Helianthus annuus]